MTANITIPVTSAIDVLSVPLAAVFTEDTSSQRYVYLKKGEMFEKTPVQIGVSDYFNAEVTSGVKEGDVVALEMPDDNLIAGEKKASGGAGGKPKGPPSGGSK
jgi:HlyD family secretion protein